MKRYLKSYDFNVLKSAVKFVEVNEDSDPYKELAKSVAYGHCKYSVNSKILTSRNHLNRAVTTWSKRNHFTPEQTARLKKEVIEIFNREKANKSIMSTN